MNKLLVCATALGLLVGVPASAQKDDHNRDKNNAAASQTDHGSPPADNSQDSQVSAPARQQDQNRTRNGNAPANSVNMNKNLNKGTAADRPNPRGPVTHPNTPSSNNSTNHFLPASGDTHPNSSDRSNGSKGQNNPGWSGNPNNRQPAANTPQGRMGSIGNTAGRQTDFSSMRRNIQAPKHFRSGRYSAPQGYQYHHWSYGERLPRGYFVRNYWIANFMMFGLFAPPSDLVWVRVDDDALLIDRDSGEIVQVRYGVFY